MNALVAVAFAAISSASAPAAGGALPVDPRTVQSVEVTEFVPTAFCPAVLDKEGRPCSDARRTELRRLDRERALALINGVGAARRCKDDPTHAFIVRTTTGPKVFLVQLPCEALGGRQLNALDRVALLNFLRAQGLVKGL